MSSRRLVWLVLLAVPLAVQGTEVYRWVQPDGTVVYSDEPTPGAERIEVEGVPSYTPPPLPAAAPAKGEEGAQGSAQYTNIVIERPTAEETVRDNEGNVVVDVAMTPSLDSRLGHRLVPLVDGTAQGSFDAQQFALSGLDRGSHELRVKVVDADGHDLGSSAPVTFFVKQTSRLEPLGPTQFPGLRPGATSPPSRAR